MTRLRTLSTHVAWTPWTDAAFARARSQRKPSCFRWPPNGAGRAARWTGRALRIRAAATTHQRAIRADPRRCRRAPRHRRPLRPRRLADDRLPLASEGHLLGGGTFIPAERLGAVLARGARRGRGAFSAGRRSEPSAASARRPSPERPPSPTPCSPRSTSVHGGFGGAPKFPHWAPLRLALDGVHPAAAAEEEAHGRPDARRHGLARPLRRRARRVLPLRGRGRTGTIRTRPSASMTTRTSSGFTSTPARRSASTRFTERAADALRYVQTWLADPVDGGWYGGAARRRCVLRGRRPPNGPDATPASQPPDVRRLDRGDGLCRASRGGRVRRRRAAPVLADVAGTRAAGLLQAGRRRRALPRRPDRRCRGLLVDQVAMASACLDAHEATGNVVYSMMAEELMHFAARTLWDEDRGGFFDRAAPTMRSGRGRAASDTPAPLRHQLPRRRRAQAARGHLRRPRVLARYADRTLASLAPYAGAQGLLAAHYLLALR
jgi:hypothetical protein